MKRLLSPVLIAMGALAPMATYADSRSVGEATVKGAITGVVLTVVVLVVAYWRRQDKERADFEASKSALAKACANGQLKKVIALVESGDDVNEQDELGGTALMLAARNNRLPVVKYLLEHGAKTDLKTKSGTCAFDIAVKRGNSEIADAIAQRNLA